MGSPVVSAIFLFNNRFEPNVPILDELYKDRFSRRTYIMPFATLNRPDVVRVQEAGWYFHGHLAQAADRILDDEVTHYVVISDDLFLNPAINEHNILDKLHLCEQAAWIKSLAGADGHRHSFPWAADGAFQMQRAKGNDLWAMLPPAEEAKRRFEALGIAFPTPLPRSAADLKFLFWSLPRHARLIWVHLMAMTGRPSPYPLLMGYADFLVLPAHGMKRFLEFCGIFAAMNLFVELAIPTALPLAYNEIQTELEHDQDFRILTSKRRADAALQGQELVDPAPFGESLGWSRRRLIEEFPADWLYVHPVKFSRWNADSSGRQ